MKFKMIVSIKYALKIFFYQNKCLYIATLRFIAHVTTSHIIMRSDSDIQSFTS